MSNRLHNRQPKTRRESLEYDRWILFTALALIAFGLLMVASASMVISDKQFGFPLHYFFRQSVYVCLGLVLVWIIMRIPVEAWKKASPILLLLGILSLLAVLVPGIGRVVNGSRRWINLGFVSLQVSEAVKFAAILYLASYLERFQEQVQTQFIGFLKPMILLALMSVLLLMQPDFGAVTVIATTFLALLFIAGVRLWPFSILFLGVIGAMTTLAITSPYRLERITTFLNPWKTAFGSGYQLTQSLIAFGRGGVFGVGLGNSIQKLFYLPEAHTDFLFAVIAEELGFLGELFLIALFALLVIRMISIGRRAYANGDLFSAYFTYGAAIWIGFQALINMGVNAGVLPTKGLTLPFMSYGGSSMLVNCAVIGLVLRISYESKRDKGGRARARY